MTGLAIWMPHLEKLLSYVIVINYCQGFVSPKAASFTLSYFSVQEMLLPSSKQYAGRAIVIIAKMSKCKRESCWVWIFFFLLGEQEKFLSHLYLIKLFRATNYNHALLKIITNSCEDYRCERIYCLLVFLICIIDFAGKSFKNNLYYIDFKGKSWSNVL